MKDFFKFKSMKEEHGAGDIGTPSLVAKYKTGTPGQTSAPPTRQPARKGDKLNAVIAKEKKPVVKENNEMEKSEMAETQLHFISYAAEEILEYIDMGGEIEEWYQNKLSKAHSDMEGLHSYIEGEKRRTGMDESHLEEADQIDELKTSTLTRYGTKAVQSLGQNPEKTDKRVKGIRTARYKVQQKYVKKEEFDFDEATNDLEEGMKPYVSSTSPKLGEKGSHDVVDKNGKVVKSHPYTKGGMQMAQIHLKKLQNEEVTEGDNKQMKGKDPCWKGYQMVGMKKKGDKSVPNCVPTNEASYKVDVEGLPTMYIDSKSPGEVKSGLRKLLRKPDSINSVERVMDADVRKAFRLKAQGKDETVEEGVMKNIKRSIMGTDAESRAGDEITKMMKAQQSGDKAAATKYNSRYKKLVALTKKEEYKSDAQRKAVWASRNEKLDPSQGAGEYVKDFEKSDAPQFKGKNKKERQKMAVAAYLSAKRGD